LIVLDKPKLKFLLAGRTITVTVPHDRFRRGRSYSVSTAYNKPASCTATVVGIRVTASGRELDIIQNRDQPDEYMARYSPKGYTSRLADALGREDAPVLDRATQARYSKDAREADLARASMKHDETPTVQQLVDLERRAAAGDGQAQRHLFMIKKHLTEAAERKSRDAA
jgi:hypothetical protein